MVTQKHTIKEVAELAGVSKTTISHAISGKRPVSAETKLKISHVIQELGFHPNTMAQSLTTKKTGIIGMVLPVSELSSSDTVIVENIVSSARKMDDYGYKLLLLNTPYENTAEILKIVRGGHVDGLILMDIRLEDERVNLLTKEGFPFSMIGRCKNNPDLDYVDIDGSLAIYKGTKYLIELGHTNIACIGILPWDFSYTYRGVQGYKKALKEAGLKYQMIDACPCTARHGYLLMKELLGNEQSFSAVISCGDQITTGIMEALRESGVKVPLDLSVITFGNSPLCLLTSPPLTALTLRVGELSEIAVEILVNKLNGTKQKPQQILLTPELVVRETTGLCTKK